MVNEEKRKEIKLDIEANKIVLFMKGNQLAPQCGFSSQVVQILNQLEVEYVTRDILLDEDLRQEIKVFSDWPTLPQLYVGGEFVGGCDIVMELFESGELKKIVSG